MTKSDPKTNAKIFPFLIVIVCTVVHTASMFYLLWLAVKLNDDGMGIILVIGLCVLARLMEIDARYFLSEIESYSILKNG